MYHCNSMLLVSTEQGRSEPKATAYNPPPPNYIHTSLRKRLTLLSLLTKPKPKTQAETPHGQ